MSGTTEEPVGVTDWNDRVVEITPRNLEPALVRLRDWFAEGRVDGVCLKGFDGQPIPFDAFDFVRFLAIQRSSDIDLGGLHALQQLTVLRLDEDVSRAPIDVSPLARLQTLSVSWGRGFTGIERLAQLQLLMIRRCALPDLASLGVPASVTDLRLIHGALESLDGLQRVSGLQQLRLWHLYKLTDISAVRSQRQLRRFEGEALKKVASFEALGACVDLEHIDIEKCGSMPTLKWMQPLQALKGLNISGTEVADRDLSILAGMPALRHFAATRKKDYAPTVADIEQLLARRRHDDASTT